MAANLREHHYVSGRPFFTVECDECNVVLNSGHHYTEINRRHAEALVFEHNDEHHYAPGAAVHAVVFDALLDDEPESSGWLVDGTGLILLAELIWLALKDGVGSVGLREATTVWAQSTGNYGEILVHRSGLVDRIPFERKNIVADLWHWQEREV